ncbi:hypothetical protein ACMD2_16177 [Ananas comosus]|uniref:F-box domain-containing protein n=1 Tax=Ananas comosus TaxID=4615 RepID=A0A199UDE8_ANACO|nr:hypothetical protein ACMD2_16177 [Ananas comosus]
MDGADQYSSSSAAVGLCLLPWELLVQEILLRLSLPDLLRLRSVSRPLSSLLSSDSFRRLYHLRHSSASSHGWVFVFKKRPPRDAVLRGFHGAASRWFRIPVAPLLLPPAVPPGEDLFLLAASGPFFLFASNGLRALLAVDLSSRSLRRLPPSPLGPRGTSSWRRSSLHLSSDLGPAHTPLRFRFLFAELVHHRPFLFEYRSDADAWRSFEAAPAPAPAARDAADVYLHVAQSGPESLVLRAGPDPVVYRPRFPPGEDPRAGDRMHVHGNGHVAVIRSAAAEEGAGGRARARVVTGVELWGMAPRGGGGGGECAWEMTSRVPREGIEEIRKPYGVMMGCLAERDGVVRLVLLSNCKGSWDSGVALLRPRPLAVGPPAGLRH